MQDNNATSNKGEQLSFQQLFSEKKWRIEIPIIQRDYAQGRESATSIRNALIDVLYKHITENKSIDLDFVYGGLTGENNKTLILLDGQQRITTLFLLHWYLANKENKVKVFQDFMLSDKDSNFTYATRASAHEFCNALVRCEIDFNNLLNSSGVGRLSKTLKDKSWYFESWENDPTIKAMLTMLDSIDEKFMNTHDLFDRIINEESPVITFQFLNFETFGLTDDLYIKMNARGKQLTDFENFKAKLEQSIKRLYNNLPEFKLEFGNITKYVKAHEYFSYKIDTEWADLFWIYRNNRTNTFDTEIMNFFNLIITNYYALISNDDSKYENLRQLIGKTNTDNIHTYFLYDKLGCMDEGLICNLILIMDLLAKNDKHIKTYLDDGLYYEEEKVFKSALLNNTSYTEKLRFYAMYQFLIQFKATDGLSDWMRVIYNLTENIIYNRPEEYVRSIIAIKELLSHGQNILAYLVDTNNKIDSFPANQIYEERLKAALILRNDEWRKAILITEKHPYFKGQIGFILEFSGIFEYYQIHRDCNWNEKTNNDYIDEFRKYSSKAGGLFGQIKESSETIDYLWERAVLTKGDYLTIASSLRRNLLSTRLTKNNIARDHSWKRLLRLTVSGQEQIDKDTWSIKRGYVKAVFDDPYFDIGDIKKSLQKICDSAMQNPQIATWKKYFIRDKSPISYCEQGFISYYYENNIQLLGQSQLNHYHAELRSYALYTSFIVNRCFQPFKNSSYRSVKSSGEDSYVSIEGFKWGDSNYEIQIRFMPSYGQYEICCINANYSQFHESIRDKLVSMQMKDTNYHKYTKIEKTEDATITFLEQLCKLLLECSADR